MGGKANVVDFDDTLFFTQRCRDAACMEILGRKIPHEALRKLEPKAVKTRIYDLANEKYWHLSRPNRRLIRILKKADASGHSIIILTARVRKSRGDTIRLLKEYGVPFHRLILRPNSLVHAPDEAWKLGEINELAGKYDEIDFYEDKMDNIMHFRRWIRHRRKTRFILVEKDGAHTEVI